MLVAAGSFSLGVYAQKAHKSAKAEKRAHLERFLMPPRERRFSGPARSISYSPSNSPRNSEKGTFRTFQRTGSSDQERHIARSVAS
jgi:hypothetical protein